MRCDQIFDSHRDTEEMKLRATSNDLIWWNQLCRAEGCPNTHRLIYLVGPYQMPLLKFVSWIQFYSSKLQLGVGNGYGYKILIGCK